ncbi:restriction endonuclease PLD domain-containing protein [Janthinobacterium sp. P210005]
MNQKLHSKIYVFSKDAKPFAGVVTSANFTL